MYKHTQTGWLVIALALFLMIILPFLLPRGYGMLIMMNICVSVAIGLLLLLLFSSLTVTVSKEMLKVIFGIGLITIKIPLNDVTAVKAVKNNWWWGWGIHGYPGKCWLFNVSGFDSVEVSTKSGMKYLIGTDEPDKLSSAISNSISR